MICGVERDCGVIRLTVKLSWKVLEMGMLAEATGRELGQEP